MKKISVIYNKIKFRIKMRRMDELWYLMCGNCFGLFPPSFYLTYTQEEIERITREEIAELREMVDKMKV
jgi:hypothetical protein